MAPSHAYSHIRMEEVAMSARHPEMCTSSAPRLTGLMCFACVACLAMPFSAAANAISMRSSPDAEKRERLIERRHVEFAAQSRAYEESPWQPRETEDTWREPGSSRRHDALRVRPEPAAPAAPNREPDIFAPPEQRQASTPASPPMQPQAKTAPAQEQPKVRVSRPNPPGTPLRLRDYPRSGEK